MQSTPAVRASWLAPVLTALLLAIAAVGVVQRLDADRVTWSVFADRDAYRASRVPVDRPRTGPEFTRGGRIPGGALYRAEWLLAKLGEHPVVQHRLMIGLDALAILVLLFALFRHVGAAGAAAAAALMACCPERTALLFGVLYNPNYTMLPLALAYACAIEALGGGRPRMFAAAMGLAALAAQAHLTCALLLIAFPLALRCAGTRIGVRGAVLAVACVALVYAPFLAREVRRGFPALREAASRAQVVRTSPWTYVASGRAPGGDAARSFGGLGRMLVAFPVEPEAAAGERLARTFFLAMALLGLCGAFGADPRARLARAMLVILVAGIAGLSTHTLEFTSRYVLFLVPAAAVLAALGAQRAVERLAALEGRAAPAACTALAAWAVWCAAADVAAGTRLSPPWLSPAGWREVAGELQWRWNVSRQALKERLTVLYPAGDGWVMPNPIDMGATMLLDQVTGQPWEGHDGSGFLVLCAPKGAPPISAERIDAALRLLPPSPALEVLDVHRIRGFTFLRYRTPCGNALRNVNDRYVPSMDESVLESALTLAPRALTRVLAREPGRFAVAHRLVPGDDDPVRVSVTLSGPATALRATFVSRDLRGYDGIRSAAVKGVAVALEPPGGGPAVARLAIHDGWMGGWTNPVLPPWTSRPASVAPGMYRVVLEGADLRLGEGAPGRGPFRHVLTDTAVIAP